MSLASWIDAQRDAVEAGKGCLTTGYPRGGNAYAPLGTSPPAEHQPPLAPIRALAEVEGHLFITFSWRPDHSPKRYVLVIDFSQDGDMSPIGIDVKVLEKSALTLDAEGHWKANLIELTPNLSILR